MQFPVDIMGHYYTESVGGIQLLKCDIPQSVLETFIMRPQNFLASQGRRSFTAGRINMYWWITPCKWCNLCFLFQSPGLSLQVPLHKVSSLIAASSLELSKSLEITNVLCYDDLNLNYSTILFYWLMDYSSYFFHRWLPFYDRWQFMEALVMVGAVNNVYT